MDDSARRRDAWAWSLAFEASAWLILAALALRVLTFASIVTLITPPRRAARDRSSPDDARAIAWAVDAATGRAPWRALCFERALAAGAMLRVRGHGPSLHYGAKTGGDSGVVAHVWVTVDGVDVVGCEEASAFALLATFPPGGKGEATNGQSRA